MALDQLLSALEREAQATADRVLAEARAEVARLTAVAADEIAQHRDAVVTPRIREARAAMEAALGLAGREVRGEVLRARARLLARIFAVTRDALASARTRDDYVTAVPARIDAALACIGGNDDIVIRCPSPLVGIFRSAIRDRVRVSVHPDDTIVGGFVLATESGSVTIDDTLEFRLERNATALARIALQALERPA